MPHVDTPQSTCRFGIARCDITPPVGIYHRMWGAATHDRAAGVHRPLTATAMVFQAAGQPPSAETEVALVAVDHCLLWAREMSGLRESVRAAAGLEREQLLVTFSHTHSAGLMGLERVSLPGGELIPPYLENLAGRIAEIVRAARHSVQPVVITYGTGRCSLAAHRDFWDAASGQFVCGFNPDGPADDTVVVARVSAADGRPVATVVNYACHPTTLAWENQLISPDYPGAMREVVQQATGVPCVFIQGASGDLGPLQGYVGDPAVADCNGRQLGFAALAALESLPPPGTRFEYIGPVVSGATLGTWSQVPLDDAGRRRCARWQLRQWSLDLPYRSDLPTIEQARTEHARWQSQERAASEAGNAQQAREGRAMVERMTRLVNRLENLPPGESFPLPVTVWRIGDAVWLAVEGEHYQRMQHALRERFPDTPIVVATLTNGARPAYLPTADAYGKGIYQESIAVLAAGSLERVIEAVSEQIQTLLSG